MALKLGFHILPTDDQLIYRLHSEVLSSSASTSTSTSTSTSHDDIVYRDLYCTEPWKVLKDEDPWEISNSMEKSRLTRKIYVFTELKKDPMRNRAARVAGKGTWSGSTGGKNVEGERPGSVIGIKSYLEYKFQQDHAVSVGHWTMHEYKLGGESYKGLESNPRAKNLVLCVITHVVDKSLGFHLGWNKTAFKIFYEKFKGLGFFQKKRQQPEDQDQENVDELQNKNKRQRTKVLASSAPVKAITIQELTDVQEGNQELSIEEEDLARDLEDMLVQNTGDEENKVVVNDDEGGYPNESSCYLMLEFGENYELVDVNWREFSGLVTRWAVWPYDQQRK